MTKIISIVIVFLLLAINWLAFHDWLEPHSMRDWLTLAVSLLIIGYLLAANKPLSSKA